MMCGIILPSGKDCPKPVRPGSELNLCDAHLAQAHEAWIFIDPKFEPVCIRCPVCGTEETYPGWQGRKCAHCGWETSDFKGNTREPEFLPPPKPRPVHVVYYIQFGNRVKIGTSGNVRNRLAVLPHDRVLAFEPGDERVERWRHAQFRSLRVRGEWFRAEPGLLDHAAELASRHAKLMAALGFPSGE